MIRKRAASPLLAPHSEYYQYINKNLEPQAILDKLTVKILGSFGDYQLITVDGEYIRDKVDQEFCEGGNFARYPYVPFNQIWVECSLEDHDMAATLIHECVETGEMQNYAMDYDSAHALANIYENKFRATGLTGDPFKLFTDFMNQNRLIENRIASRYRHKR
jgi:hypothetical protein